MCTCIAEFNEKLAEHNAAIVTTMFASPCRAVVATYKRDEKKRGKPPVALASYCPFCGERYEAQAAEQAA